VASEPEVLIRVDAGVAVVTLNRPAKLNAINAELWAAFDRQLDALREAGDVRAVVLTGAGRAFCAGADLAGGDLPAGFEPGLAAYEAIASHQLRLWSLPQPVIAAVHGYCLGRGMELALWCDIVLASADARLGQPEVRDGSFVASIVPWLTNPQRAKLLMLTGDTISAREARECGLVTEVVPEGHALPAAEKLAQRLTHLPVPTARSVKRYVAAVQEAQGLLATQRYGSTLAATLRSLSAREMGIEELVRIREQAGLKAYLAARDAPFARE
jgi:enoyl-CoA hydratase/carnithine racemase